MRAGSSSSTAHAPPRAAGSNTLPLYTLIAGPIMLEEEHKARIDGVVTPLQEPPTAARDPTNVLPAIDANHASHCSSQLTQAA